MNKPTKRGEITDYNKIFQLYHIDRTCLSEYEIRNIRNFLTRHLRAYLKRNNLSDRSWFELPETVQDDFICYEIKDKMLRKRTASDQTMITKDLDNYLREKMNKTAKPLEHSTQNQKGSTTMPTYRYQPVGAALAALTDNLPKTEIEHYLLPYAKPYTATSFSKYSGFAIAITDREVTTIVHNRTRNNGIIPDDVLLKLLQLPNNPYGLIFEPISQWNDTDQHLYHRLLWHIQYQAEDFPDSFPTVTENVPDGCEVLHHAYHVEIELLFAESDHLTRTVVIKQDTVNIPPMELVYDLFDNEDFEEIRDAIPDDPNFLQYVNDEDNLGYEVLFYTPSGMVMPCYYRSAKQLLNHLVSFRVIKSELYKTK